MVDVFEAIKTIGGLSGIATAAFLIRDRWTKHYPVVLFEAHPLIEGGAHIEMFVRLKNVSDRTVLLSWPRNQGCGLYIARNDSKEGIFEYLLDGETAIALSPQTERLFPLLKPRTYAEIDPENVMKLEVFWRFAQPIIWRAPRTLRATIRKKDFEALIEGYVALRANE